jgi:hypothetical protein
MKIKTMLFYAIPIVLGGCIPIMSINPFYKESDVMFEQKIVGTWVQDTNEPATTWKFSRNEEEPNKAYHLTFIDQEGNKGSYTTVLMKIENKLFLDVYPDKMPWDTEDSNNISLPYNTFFLVPAHTIIKVEQIEPKLVLRLTLSSKFKELIEEHPNEIESQEGEDTIVLKSSTKELQAFILKYSQDEKMFPDEIILEHEKE